MKINIKNLQSKVAIPKSAISKLAFIALAKERIRKRGEITFCFVTDRKIKSLNAKYLKRRRPTDVIAFDIGNQKDKNNIFADIIISSERAIFNAEVFKTSVFYELCLYAVHGLLHILGYTDNTVKTKQLMQKKEKRILECLSTMQKQ